MLPPVIVLAPPRSGTTVVTAMLGQHPSLAGLPEMNVFLIEGMAELLAYDRAAVEGTSCLSGIRRAVAREILHRSDPGAAAAAQAWLEARAAQPVFEVVNELRRQLAPRRAVLKCTRVALVGERLARVLRQYPEAHFLHLLRSPVETVASLLRVWRSAHPDAPAELGAASFFWQQWLHAHRNLETTLAVLPAKRQLRLRTEECLGAAREHALRHVLHWLGLEEGHAELARMQHPENSPYAFPAPTFGGDDGAQSFLERPHLRPWAQEERVAPVDWQISPAQQEQAHALWTALG